MAKSTVNDPDGFVRKNEAAVREGREADRVEPRASAAYYDAARGLILVELRSGFAFAFPPERVPGLEQRAAPDLGAVRISPSGDGLHWDELDVDVSLTGLMAQALNLREWAPRFMGQVRSDAKARAARVNGLKGGRPRQSTRPSRKAKKAP
jgi:hypothetical protein